MDSDVKTFSPAEAVELWANILHRETTHAMSAFKYAPWMEPLARIYSDRYYNKYDALLRVECRQVYVAGLSGDLDAVDRFVGGYELTEPQDDFIEELLDILNVP